MKRGIRPRPDKFVALRYDPNKKLKKHLSTWRRDVEFGQHLEEMETAFPGTRTAELLDEFCYLSGTEANILGLKAL